MPEAVEQPAKPSRTWLPMSLWSAGLLLTIGLVWCGAAIVAPFVGTDRVLRDYDKVVCNNPPPAAYGILPDARSRAIRDLGGPSAAIHRLRIYLKMPSCLAGYRKDAVSLLSDCGPDAAPALAEALHHSDVTVRTAAAIGFQSLGADGSQGTHALANALQDTDAVLRRESARALGMIGRSAKDAVPALEKALTDLDPFVRSAAAEALKKIRGKEPPK